MDASEEHLAGERESVFTGALGGAALGSVIALAISSTTVMSPVVGGLLGIVGGSGVGHLLNRHRERTEERRGSDVADRA